MIAHTRHRKYANAKTYHAFKEGELKGIFPLEWKMSEKELKEFLLDIKRVSNADTIILHWDALRGIVDEKVEI